MLEDRISALIATLAEMECAIGALSEIQTQAGLARVNVLLRSLRSGDVGAALRRHWRASRPGGRGGGVRLVLSAVS
ncbi:hypothetical protein SAMN04488105_104140 [Salipiger thiooxidans]|uniref:Uncharacterized protein n=1 Tax=Salipiger thiooxidans TaxID=282683 RepID=A0A1G7DCP9_9RHOB|nr:hypothetical protein [Salipiger thiooxidans]SDE49322.1 hypothetical protein SAMN04488105_104140 [Salipiger thiooxidans]